MPDEVAGVDADGGTGFLSAAKALSTASVRGWDLRASFDAPIVSSAVTMRIPDTSEDDPAPEMVAVEAIDDLRPWISGDCCSLGAETIELEGV